MRGGRRVRLMEALKLYGTIWSQPLLKHLIRLASSSSTITALTPKTYCSTLFLRRCSSTAISTGGDGKVKLSGRNRRSSSSNASSPSSTSDREAVRAIRLKKVLLKPLRNALYSNSTPSPTLLFLDLLECVGHSCGVRLKN